MPWNPSDMESYREDMVKDLMDIISIPALSPKNGGEGEGAKADKICEILERYGIEYRRYDTGAYRLNTCRKIHCGKIAGNQI